MDKYKEQTKRWNAILGDVAEEAQEDCLEAYFQHLLDKLSLPCEVTGVEDFRWEERYVFGGCSQREYAQLKKSQPSYKDKYDLLSIARDGYSEWGMFEEDIVAHVRRKSDGKEFDLGLAELKAMNKKSANFQVLDDYAGWLVNNR